MTLPAPAGAVDGWRDNTTADPRWQRTTPGRDRDPADRPGALPVTDIRIRLRLGRRAIVRKHPRSEAVLSRHPWTPAAPGSRVGNARRNTRPARPPRRADECLPRDRGYRGQRAILGGRRPRGGHYRR